MEIAGKLRFDDGIPKLSAKIPSPPALLNFEGEFENWLVETGRIPPSQWDRKNYPPWYVQHLDRYLRLA